MNQQFAVIFPGQGSQSVGMMQPLASEFAFVADIFREAGEILDRDLWGMVESGPKDVLDQTQNTQPAMLCAGIAVWRVWMETVGAAPVSLVGHSLGEYTALTCAGVLSFPDAIRLVAERARLMQEAVPAGAGAMAAILGLDDAQVIAACAAVAGNGVVEAVNFNAPGQVVIAGDRLAVEQAIEACKSAGAKRAILLPVSVPSHCRLMQPAAEQLLPGIQQRLAVLPAIPVIHNAAAQSAETLENLHLQLYRQLFSPVRWVDSLKMLHRQGIRLLLEFGPGKVLSGLCKRIEPDLKGLPVYDLATLNAAKEAIHGV